MVNHVEKVANLLVMCYQRLRLPLKSPVAKCLSSKVEAAKVPHLIACGFVTFNSITFEIQTGTFFIHFK